MRYRAARASILSWQSRLDDEPAADAVGLWRCTGIADQISGQPDFDWPPTTASGTLSVRIPNPHEK